MKTEVITRYKPRTLKIKIGATDIKAQVAVHWGYWFCAECEVKPLEVWSGGIYHGAGQIDFATRYCSGEVRNFLPVAPVNIDGMIAGLEAAPGFTEAGAFVGNVSMKAGTEYKVSLNRPPAPPDVEYPENPLLYYLTLSVNLPNEGWELV